MKNIKLLIASEILNREINDLILNDFQWTEEMENIFLDFSINKKPLSKIFQKKRFWQYDFFTNENTLDPRPDTEIIIEIMLKRFKKEESLFFLDLGTGTGAIGITLAKNFPQSKIIAIDICPKALEIAKKNAKNLKCLDQITFLQNNWLENIENILPNKNFILVSNPPYLLENEITKELTFDPEIALIPFKGAKNEIDRLEKYLKIYEKRKLFSNCFMEICPQMTELCIKYMPENKGIYKDFGNRNRVLFW